MSQSKTINVEAQQIPGFYVAGISLITSNDNDRAADDINALWQRFFEENTLHKITGRADNVLYCVYSDYEGDHTKPYRVTIGCKLNEAPDDVPEGLHKVHVPPADYAIFSARGEQPKSLIQTWQAIWSTDMKRTYKADVEIYGPRFFEDGVNEVLVCVGVNL